MDALYALLSYLDDENPLMAKENPFEAYSKTRVPSLESIKMVRMML
jgi:hypothetical protein